MDKNFSEVGKDWCGKSIFNVSVNNKDYEINWSYFKTFHSSPPLESSEHYYKNQFLEHLNNWSRFIKEGDIALDIGSSVLDTTLPLACLVGTGGKVLAFDPSPSLKETAEENLKNNPGLNIEFYPFAIGDGSILDFKYQDGFTNGGPSFATQHFGTIFTQSISFQTIDFISHFSEKIDFSKISFIKIDTEGFDCFVVKYLYPIINAYKPTLQVECFPGTEAMVLSLCEQIGYNALDPSNNFEIVGFGNFASKKRHDLILVSKSS